MTAADIMLHLLQVFNIVAIFTILLQSTYLLVYSREWWALMVCPWSMGQQESMGRNIGRMEELCLCPKSGLHPLRPRHRARPRLSPRDRSAMSTPTPSLCAGLPPPRIKTPWVRYANNAGVRWATVAVENHKYSIWFGLKSVYHLPISTLRSNTCYLNIFDHHLPNSVLNYNLWHDQETHLYSVFMVIVAEYQLILQ